MDKFIIFKLIIIIAMILFDNALYNFHTQAVQLLVAFGCLRLVFGAGISAFKDEIQAFFANVENNVSVVGFFFTALVSLKSQTESRPITA